MRSRSAHLSYVDLNPSSTPLEVISRFALMAHPTLRPRLFQPDSQEALIALGGFWAGRPAGLLVATLFQATATCHLLSLFVTPECRQRGLGSFLLHTLEQLARQKKIRTLVFSSLRQEKVERLSEGFLTKAGWPPFETEIYLARSTIADSSDDPYVKEPFPLPADCELFPWVELAEEEKRKIAALEGSPGWYDHTTSPFAYEEYLEPVTSLGVRYKGEVVGWMITHRMSREILRYSSWFVKEDLRNLGIAAPLILNAFHLQVFVANIPIASLQIRPGNRRMDLFMRKRVFPYLTHFMEQRTSRLQLIPES